MLTNNLKTIARGKILLLAWLLNTPQMLIKLYARYIYFL